MNNRFVPLIGLLISALAGLFIWVVGKAAIITILGLFLVAGGGFLGFFGVETRSRLQRKIRKAESDRGPKGKRRRFRAKALFILFDVSLIAWVLATLSAVVAVVLAFTENWSLPR